MVYYEVTIDYNKKDDFAFEVRNKIGFSVRLIRAYIFFHKTPFFFGILVFSINLGEIKKTRTKFWQRKRVHVVFGQKKITRMKNCTVIGFLWNLF